MNTEFNAKRTALKLALKKLFTQNFFSVSAIDRCLEMTGVIPDKEVYQIMHTVHCIDYSEMDKDFRQWLFEQTILMFNNTGFDIDRLDILDGKTASLYLPEEKNGWNLFKKLT